MGAGRSGGGARAAGGPGVSAALVQTNVKVHGVPNLVNLIIAVDMSGSMSEGDRWGSVRRGIDAALDAISGQDVVTVILFNEGVRKIGPLPRSVFPKDPLRTVTPNGGTSLYDAIVFTLIEAIKLHKAVDDAVPIPRTTYCVVLTDGADGNSRCTLREVCEILRQVNVLRDFEVIFAGVDLPAQGRAALTTLGSVGDNDIQFMEMTDGSFSRVFQHLRVVLQVERRAVVISSV